MNLLHASGFQKLERTLDAAALRQKVTANNIANVDTPYFKRSFVPFEQLLQKELSATQAPSFSTYITHPRHFPIKQSAPLQLQASVQIDENSAMNHNHNNVDIEYEMAELAKNQLNYNLLVQQVNYDIKHLRTAIGGRA